jgi:small-conductance mechanosensitive channel
LALSSQDLRTPLATFINQVVQSGEASNLQASDLGVLQQQKARLDALTLQIKNLSPAIEALDKQRVLLTVYKSHLGSWRTAVVSQYKKAWENLILRLVVLGVVIASLAGIAAVLRRVTVRHIHDANRRRMILVVQRIVIWFAIILAAAFAFASDLSSLATFLGLLTAGVAVALQNVILAVLGYFLLVGKRGIRVGDRVQISGVTGDVIDIGLLQFQLREVDMRNQQPTGHVATFSNSFVFVAPATGLFKFIPENSNASRPEVVKQISRV